MRASKQGTTNVSSTSSRICQASLTTLRFAMSVLRSESAPQCSDAQRGRGLTFAYLFPYLQHQNLPSFFSIGWFLEVSSQNLHDGQVSLICPNNEAVKRNDMPSTSCRGDRRSHVELARLSGCRFIQSPWACGETDGHAP